MFHAKAGQAFLVLLGLLVLLVAETNSIQRELGGLQIQNWQGTISRKTYRKYDFTATKAQALNACKQLGGRLALPTDKEEDEQISREIGVSFSSIAWWKMGYWISGTDEQQEGVWIDSVTGKRLKYKNFNPHQPDNNKVESPAGEHCIQKYPTYSGWNDRTCNNNAIGYVCEFTNYHM